MTGPRSFLAGPLPNLTILFPALFLGAFLLCFLILPVGQLVINALSDEGALTFDALAIFAANPLYAESLSSSLGTALGAALIAWAGSAQAGRSCEDRPLTADVITVVLGNMFLFSLIVAVFYGGELVWRDVIECVGGENQDVQAAHRGGFFG